MQLFVSLLPSPTAIDSDTEIAVVIDVLRATSVISTALAAGAERILTCREVREAESLAGTLTPRPLLCGERGCRPISGFDLGNSPVEYAAEIVKHRTLVLTTTNGTRAIAAAEKARRLITASFLNLSAVVAAVSTAERVHFVCAGTNGTLTAEDVLLAGALVTRCQLAYSADLADDESIVARQTWQSWFGRDRAPDQESLADRLRETQGGQNLISVGYGDDILRCAAMDTIALVPERSDLDPVTFVAGAIDSV